MAHELGHNIGYSIPSSDIAQMDHWPADWTQEMKNAHMQRIQTGKMNYQDYRLLAESNQIYQDAKIKDDGLFSKDTSWPGGSDEPYPKYGPDGIEGTDDDAGAVQKTADPRILADEEGNISQEDMNIVKHEGQYKLPYEQQYTKRQPIHGTGFAHEDENVIGTSIYFYDPEDRSKYIVADSGKDFKDIKKELKSQGIKGIKTKNITEEGGWGPPRDTETGELLYSREDVAEINRLHVEWKQAQSEGNWELSNETILYLKLVKKKW